MYNIFGVPRIIILNSEGEEYDLSYVHDKEVIATRWLCEHSAEKSKIYEDAPAFKSLWLGYGKISMRSCSFLQDKTIDDGYIYLRHVNVIDGKVYPGFVYANCKNITEYSHQFVGKSNIYNNGGSEIWSGHDEQND